MLQCWIKCAVQDKPKMNGLAFLEMLQTSKLDLLSPVQDIVRLTWSPSVISSDQILPCILPPPTKKQNKKQLGLQRTVWEWLPAVRAFLGKHCNSAFLHHLFSVVTQPHMTLDAALNKIFGTQKAKMGKTIWMGNLGQLCHCPDWKWLS